MTDDTRNQRILRIVGCVLIAAGLAGGIASILFQILRAVSRDCWWMATAICLLFVFRTQPLRRISRVVGLLMLLIWLNFNLADFTSLGWWINYRLDHHFLGFMLTVLGLLILITNDSRGQLPVGFRRLASIAGARRKAALAVCVASLWIVNPENSHSLCLGAADICEEVGANRPAITFTRLARDTFPPESFCGNCYFEIRQDLSQRIIRLQAGRGSRRAQSPNGESRASDSPAPAIRRPAG